jgi:hypothetical protein
MGTVGEGKGVPVGGMIPPISDGMTFKLEIRKYNIWKQKS